MKILYAIQGTGNGHLARAEDVIPELQHYGQVDILVSGVQADIAFPFPVTYRSKGLSFFFGKRGGVDFFKTLSRNSLLRVHREISHFPVDRYDVVINDFEPISAWAAHIRNIPCIGLSHQAALLSPKVPRPNFHDPMGAAILRHYAPCKAALGFHFKSFDENIFTPVIRKRIREAEAQDLNHYTVYLPAYDDRKLIRFLSHFPGITWHVFSKHTRHAYQVGHIHVRPVNNEQFVQSLLTCTGILCGAGFETPAEALYLGKKLMVIPMRAQYEQHYNACALKELGIRVLNNLHRKNTLHLQHWIDEGRAVHIPFKQVTKQAVESAMHAYRKYAVR